MIGGVGQNSGLARAAIEAALKAQGKSAQAIDSQVGASFQAAEARIAGAAGPATAQPTGQATGAPQAAEAVAGFSPESTASIQETVGGLNESFTKVDNLPLELANGEISDFSQLAAQLKQSELTFKFALEVRNKLIDAYRETMRMSV